MSKDKTEIANTSDKTETLLDKKYNVNRFLQIRPQQIGCCSLLKKYHGSEKHTIAEWEELVQSIMRKKVK